MNIEDFEINIKKYDREKNHVIVNLLIKKIIEIRGFIVRYTPTKYSKTSIWIVTPTSVKKGKFFFHVVRIKDHALWAKLEQKIINAAIEYTDAI